MLSPEVASEVCLRTGSQAYEPYWLRASVFSFPLVLVTSPCA